MCVCVCVCTGNMSLKGQHEVGLASTGSGCITQHLQPEQQITLVLLVEKRSSDHNKKKQDYLLIQGKAAGPECEVLIGAVYWRPFITQQ